MPKACTGMVKVSQQLEDKSNESLSNCAASLRNIGGLSIGSSTGRYEGSSLTRGKILATGEAEEDG
jgi:hypothetical protein